MRSLHRSAHALFLALSLVSCASLTGCFVVGGSSRGGFFIWPGSIGLIVIVLLFLLLRRR